MSVGSDDIKTVIHHAFNQVSLAILQIDFQESIWLWNVEVWHLQRKTLTLPEKVCKACLQSEEHTDMFDYIVFLFSRGYCIQVFEQLPNWNVFKPSKKQQGLTSQI